MLHFHIRLDLNGKPTPKNSSKLLKSFNYFMKAITHYDYACPPKIYVIG